MLDVLHQVRYANRERGVLKQETVHRENLIDLVGEFARLHPFVPHVPSSVEKINDACSSGIRSDIHVFHFLQQTTGIVTVRRLRELLDRFHIPNIWSFAAYPSRHWS